MVDHFSRMVRNSDFRRKWRENRDIAERTLNKRRQRYASDPEYREMIKTSVKRSRESKRTGDRKRSFNRDKEVIVDGVSVVLFSSGKASNIIGVSNRTIEGWEKRGIVPLNRVRDTIGRKWYPSEFVFFLAEHFAERKDCRCDEWSGRVKEAWQLRQLSKHPIPIVGEYLEEHHG